MFHLPQPEEIAFSTFRTPMRIRKERDIKHIIR